MSIDRSLKTSGTLSQHRNVLSRDERIKKLTANNGFKADQKPVLGLPKTANRKPV